VPPPLEVSDGVAVGLPVSVGVELAVVLGVPVGVGVSVSDELTVGVGVADGVGDVRDGPVTGRVAVAVAVGLTHAVVAGVAGRAEETAAAIFSLDPVGVALTAAG
jgi:hypothetical protein